MYNWANRRVGCAVLTESGAIVTGANVENALYGAAICAERTAITRCVMEGHTTFRAIAISSDMDEPITPCGICRQFIREFSRNVPIYMYAQNGDGVCMSLEELLPRSFGPEHLLE